MHAAWNIEMEEDFTRFNVGAQGRGGTQDGRDDAVHGCGAVGGEEGCSRAVETHA
jgi:hypothetical protein